MIDKHAKGFGLIELMIAITLGLFLIAGLYTLLGSSQQSYALNRANSSLSNSGQRVTQLLANVLQQSGFINYQRRLQNQIFPAAVLPARAPLSDINWRVEQSVEGGDNLTSSGLLAGSDRLSLRFYGSSINDNDPAQPNNLTADGRMFNCNGDVVGNDTLLTLSLFVNNSGELMCQDSMNNTVVMERNIESLQFRFRRASNQQGFVSADKIGADNWPDVVAVEYALLVAMPSGQGVQALPRTYQLLDTSITTAADRQVRQLLTGSMTLQNQQGE